MRFWRAPAKFTQYRLQHGQHHSRTPGSDHRVPQRERIVRIGEHALGIGLYLFEYRREYRDRWGHGTQFGVMAEMRDKHKVQVKRWKDNELAVFEHCESLLQEIAHPTSRCIVVDLGSLATMAEQRVVSDAVLAALWERRHARDPER